jgi:hypothetical protein
MKNLVATFFISLIMVSGLSTVTFANMTTNLSSIVSESIANYFTVGVFGVRSHSLYLSPGETAYIKATGDGSSDLDMFVRNASDEMIISDERESTDGYVKFTAKRGGYYYVNVVNNGRTYNTYKLEVTIY